MYEYAFDVSLARVAIVIGLFIALLLYERYKVSPGGMIVPGYIALFINHPEQIIYTFILAFFVYLIVGRILMKHIILFGRRRFTITVLTGVVFAIFAESIVYSYVQFEPFAGFSFVGMIIPGLIANEFIREHKPISVLTAIGFVSIVTFSFIWLISQIELILFSEISNMAVLVILIVDLVVLISFTVYILFFLSLENTFDYWNKFLIKIKTKAKNTIHLNKRGVKHAV